MITRAEDDAAALADRLESLGAIPVLLPTIRIAWSEPGPLDRAIGRLQTYDWVIFTSRNGVEGFFRRARGITGPKVAAIGPATAAELRAHGIEPDLVPAEHVAEGLLGELGDVAGKRFLLPRAAKARKTLADDLTLRGAVVDDIPTYDTVAPDSPRPDLAGVDAITFTSGSTVQHFLEGGPVPPGARVVCIGPQTAERARSLGVEVHAVADHYTEDGLIAALIAALKR